MVVELKDALTYEGQEAALSLEDMMAEMMGAVEEGGGYIRPEYDEYTIRRMLLARNYINKDVDKLKEMKKRVSEEWDRRIKRENEKVVAIDGIVDHYVRNQNKGKSLSLDIGTVSLRRNPHRVVVANVSEAKEFFEEEGLIDEFLKPAEFDKTAAQNHFMNIFKQRVEKITEEAIFGEIQRKELKKLTKKREKEIELEVIEEELPKFNKELPEGFNLQMPNHSLSIRSNM